MLGSFRRTDRPKWMRCELQRFLSRVGVAILMGVAFSPIQGQAAPISFHFSGVLTQVVAPPPISPPDAEAFHVGQPFWGRLTYDPDTPDLFPDDPQRGYYLQDVGAGATGLELYVGQDFFRTDAAQGFGLLVANDIASGMLLELPGDSFRFRGGAAISSLNGDVPRLKLGAISAWIDPSGQVFASDALPTTFNVLAFDRMEIEASIVLTPFPFFSQIILTGAIEQIYPIPEPNTLGSV